MDRKRPTKRQLPSHGTVVAYVALFLALCGSGYAAANLPRASVTCQAIRAREHVACEVLGRARGHSAGRTVFTQAPAYVADPDNSPGYLTPFYEPNAVKFGEEQETTAEDSNAEHGLQNSIDMPLESVSDVNGAAAHLASVQFCVNISANVNTKFHGTANVSVTGASVYELDERDPGGRANSGRPSGAPAYHPVKLIAKRYEVRSTSTTA